MSYTYFLIAVDGFDLPSISQIFTWKMTIHYISILAMRLSTQQKPSLLITHPDSSAETDESLYDWVVFLGGTNDLGSGKAAVKIWDEIKAVTDLPLSTGAQVLLLTVPECGVKVEKLDKKRGALNALILEDGRKGVWVLLFSLWLLLRVVDKRMVMVE